MLSELNAIEATHGEERARDVVRAIHYLLRHQFIFAGDRGTAAAYNLVTDARFGGFIRSYLDAAGYRLLVNEAEQWAGIVPDPDDVQLPRLRVDETIALLLIGLFWQEEVERGAVAERATVLTTVNALYDRYEEAVARGRKTSVGVRRFVDILDELARRNIVELRPFVTEQQDRELVIRPQIRVLLGDDALTRLERFARDEEALIAAAAPSPEDGADSTDEQP
jgi:hypothetical protein